MGRSITLMVAAALLVAVPAWPDESSRQLSASAADQLYNLNLEQAAATFRKAIADDPFDSAAYRGLASVLWMQTAFLRGSMTVDSYLGRVSRANVIQPPLPPELVNGFREAVDRACDLARKRAEARPNDADAAYELGAAIGLRASYEATVEGSVMNAFRSARGAYDEHERVLALDPSRHDAALIVGTYRYVVAALSMPLRWVAYVAGFGGDAAKGLQLVESAAGYAGDSQTDARLALVLLYNREQRYDDALRQLAVLRARYPGNRLLWLETGATDLRAGRASDAEQVLNEGIGRFSRDERGKMFGEEALWYYKRGTARAALNRAGDAQQDLRHALSVSARDWVHGRTHLELGKLALAAGKKDEARLALHQAIVLCDRGQDGYAADEARKLLSR